MTAPDHAIKPLENFLRERGHPYMFHGLSSDPHAWGRPQPEPRFNMTRGQAAVLRHQARDGAITASNHALIDRSTNLI